MSAIVFVGKKKQALQQVFTLTTQHKLHISLFQVKKSTVFLAYSAKYCDETVLVFNNSKESLGPVHTGHQSRFAHKFACKPFDVAYNLCEHSH